MIESCYWKEELLRIANLLKRKAKPERWSERAHCVLERELMVGFFLLRRLIELHKISDATRHLRLEIFSYKSKGKRATFINSHHIWDLYDMEKEILEIKSPTYISNQFIHAYTSFVARDESRNWSDVFIVSDYDRNDCIWRIPVTVIQLLFRKASKDYPYSMTMTWNERSQDYDITCV